MQRLLLLLLLTALPLAAQEERAIGGFGGVGVRAMGMGGAYVGVADDFSAIFWNPAGLAQLRHYEVYMSFQNNGFQNDATQAGTPTYSEVSNTRFGSLGGVAPYPVHQGSLVFAAGFNRVKDFDRNLRITGFSRIDSLTVDNSFANEGELAAFSLAAAIDVSPALSLGLALNRVTGANKATSNFRQIDSQDLYLERRWVATEVFDDDYEPSWSATLGFLLRSSRQHPRFRAGATLNTGHTHEVRYSFTGVPDEFGFDRIDYDDGSFDNFRPRVIKGSYKIALPLEFGVGAAYAPVDDLLLAASAHFAQWSQSEYKGSDDLGLRANASFTDQYDDLIRYHLGLEYRVPVIALDLRAGFYSDPLPFVGPRDPNAAIDPIANPIIKIAQDRRFFTLGAGLLVDEVVQTDIAWTRGSFEQLEGQLTEEGTVTRLSLGVSYRFK